MIRRVVLALLALSLLPAAHASGDGDLGMGLVAMVCLEQDASYKNTSIGQALAQDPRYQQWRSSAGEAARSCIANMPHLPAVLCGEIFQQAPKGKPMEPEELHNKYADSIERLQRLGECVKAKEAAPSSVDKLHARSVVEPARHRVETVTAADLDARVKASKGLLVVLVSSLDPECVPCASSLRQVEDIQRIHRARATFVQVTWPKWSAPPRPVQAFMDQHNVVKFPAYVGFKDGKFGGVYVGIEGWMNLEKDLKVGHFAARAAPGTVPDPASRVEAVSPQAAANLILQSKGDLVVQVTSYDPRCGFCTPANVAFDALSKDAGNSQTRFLRINYQPWRSFANDAFAVDYDVNGLPTQFAFRDGQRVGRHNGIATVTQMKQKLLDDPKLIDPRPRQ